MSDLTSLPDGSKMICQHATILLSVETYIGIATILVLYWDSRSPHGFTLNYHFLQTSQCKIINFSLHCQLDFGAYAQTFNLTENNMHVYMTRAVVMGHSLNYQEGVLFYSPATGKTLDQSRNDCTIAPISEDVIQHMAFLGKDSPVGLVLLDCLEKSYDDKEDHGPITIRFNDTLPALPPLNLKYTYYI